jgi:CheY-like chemotaxis protein
MGVAAICVNTSTCIVSETPIRVLIVDDELTVRQSLRRLILRRVCPNQRMFVDVVANMASAIAQLEHVEYNLVITDYRMPGGTGVELLAIIERRWPRTRRLLMSGYVDVEDRLESDRTSAAERVVNKPCHVPVFLAAIQELLPCSGLYDMAVPVISTR